MLDGLEFHFETLASAHFGECGFSSMPLAYCAHATKLLCAPVSNACIGTHVFRNMTRYMKKRHGIGFPMPFLLGVYISSA